jgi:excisionase family DNA binding protein
MSTKHENAELSTKHNKENIMSENNQQEELLTVHEVARRLRVDDTTVRRWIKSGTLEAIALPHRGKRQGYRIRKSTLDNLFASSSPVRE